MGVGGDHHRSRSKAGMRLYHCRLLICRIFHRKTGVLEANPYCKELLHKLPDNIYLPNVSPFTEKLRCSNVGASPSVTVAVSRVSQCLKCIPLLKFPESMKESLVQNAKLMFCRAINQSIKNWQPKISINFFTLPNWFIQVADFLKGKSFFPK